MRRARGTKPRALARYGGGGGRQDTMSNSSGPSTAASNGGLGFVGALTILFIALKLCHVISWSWWWVLAPLWISFSLIVLFLVVLGVVFVGVQIIDSRNSRQRTRERMARRS